MTKMRPEMPQVAGQEVGGACFDGREQNGDIFFRKGNAGGQLAGDRLEQMKKLPERRETSTLIFVIKVEPRLFDRVPGRAKRDSFQFPQAQKAGIGTTCRGEKH